jgi:lysophospholipase L1-like esterase
MRRTLIIFAVAALAVASVAVPASADSQPGSVVLTVGDSVAAGVGASNPDSTGYVPRFHRAVKSSDCNEADPDACPHLELVSFAQGGATSDTLLAEQLTPAVNEILTRAGDADPNNDVEYITITIGGNDVFGPVLAACGGGVTPECVNTIQTRFAAYQANLITILGTLRTVAPEAEIGIMTYYNPLGSCELAAIAPLGDMVLEGGGGLPGGLNDIIRGVAAGTGVTTVETYGLLSTKDFVGGQDCLHPDNSGHKKIANAFAGALG